jgi:pilus assembly protein Flp/PilA
MLYQRLSQGPAGSASDWGEVKTDMSTFFERLLLKALVREEEGQTFVEYALLIAFIAIVALVAVQLLGTNISSLFNSVATHL